MAHLSEQNTLSTKLNLYKSELKLAKKAKSAIAAQFKNAAPDSELHSILIQKMQSNSVEIKSIELNLKDIENKLAELNQSQVIANIKNPPLLTIDALQIWTSEFKIREIQIEEFDKWYAYVSSIANATAYHQKAWADVIANSFQNPTRVWAAFDEGENIIGGIPLIFFNSILFGKFAVSIPYVNYGGPISNYFNINQDILKQLSSVCQKEGLSHIEVRTMQPDLAPEASSKKASMILALPNSSQELDRNLGSKIRAQYNKCEVNNPKIFFGGIELLDDFYSVFARNMRDLGTPVYSKTWFSNILKNQNIKSKLVVVYVDKKPVSTGFLVGHNRMLEIPWASTIKEANTLNTNMWMYRKILDFAIENNFDFFDFGRSTQNAGTYKFKKQWGSSPYLHHWYKILPASSNAAPDLNPDNPKFALLISVWKKLPIWFTKIIGPFIIRNIP